MSTLRAAPLVVLGLAFVACSDDAEVLSPPDSGGDVTVDAPALADAAADVTDATIDATDAADAAVDVEAGPLVCDTDAGLDACGGKCVTLATDAKNCGFCGHDCQGAACSSGLCAPQVLATGQANPIAIAVNSTNVYFLNNATGGTDGQLVSCPVTGCPNPIVPLSKALDNPTALTLDGTNVYWINSSALNQTKGTGMKCPLAGCGATNQNRTTLFTGIATPRTIAVDATKIYFGGWGTGSPNFFNGKVYSCAIGGCGAAPTTVVTPLIRASALGIDAPDLYVASAGQIPSIVRAALGSSGAGTVMDMQKDYSSLVVGTAVLYWTDFGNGDVYMCPKLNCTSNAIVLFSNQAGPDQIKVDGQGIYWLNTVSGEVRACPGGVCNGKTTLLAKTGDTLVALALSGSYAYYATQDVNGTAGKIYRVAR